METLENEKCIVIYNPDYRYKTDCFNGRDYTDQNNMPCFYNLTVRGHKKAWEEVKKIFDENTTMEKVLFTLSNNKIRTHYWCAMD